MGVQYSQSRFAPVGLNVFQVRPVSVFRPRRRSRILEIQRYQGDSQGHLLAVDRDGELPGLLVTRHRDVEALVVEDAAQAKLDRRVGKRPPAAQGALGLPWDPGVEAAPDGV